MYCNFWNIRKVRDHYFIDYSLDQGIFNKAKWQLSFKCSSSHSTLKTSIASRILTPTGGSKISFQAQEPPQGEKSLLYPCKLTLVALFGTRLGLLIAKSRAGFALLNYPGNHNPKAF
jgi:hypothetical protein